MEPATIDKTEQRQKLERVEAWLLAQPVQAEYELKHSFAPGVYLREILMLAPAPGAVPDGQIGGTLLIGHEHKFEHFNMVLSGRALVQIDGKTEEIVGPCYFKSGAGVRKVLYVLEDMRWITIHPNPDEVRDIAKLEELLVTPSQTFLTHREMLATDSLRLHAEQNKPRKEEVAL